MACDTEFTQDLHYASIPAEPEQLPRLRRALAVWAERVGMSAEQIETLTLASYEALANVASHAYPGDVGEVDLRAACRSEPARVEVFVTDYGRWRLPPAERGERGGRGMVLIRSLADHAEVTTDPAGTTVSMTWTLPDPSGA